jgi:hypothetical protein
MSAPPIKEKALEAEEAQVHRIRITLTSRKVQALERGMSFLVFFVSIIIIVIFSLC